MCPPMDAETLRDIQTKLKLAEMALTQGDKEAAQYWLDSAAKCKDEFRAFRTAV